MHRKKAVLILMAQMFLAAAQPPGRRPAQPARRLPDSFSGASALAFTAKAVSFGARPPGSPEIKKLQAYILGQLKLRSCKVVEDAFTADTPLGPVRMMNIIASFPGTSGRAVVFSGHYDTKSMPGTYFVGANDGGSSTGFLLEMARVLSGRRRKDDVYLVWFDGEEAFAQWSSTDGIYGSRHLARKWADDGTLGRIKALINVDMIGDRKLDIVNELNSSRSLRDLIWQTARDLGYGAYFARNGGPVDDDHIPFLQLGVNAADLIDFNYGPDNSYWHTEKDTMDKLSGESLQIVGRVLLAVLPKLEGP